MKRHFRHFSLLLMILALVSAGVSPACAFISGKVSQIEICGADGNIKTLTVNADGTPAAPSGSQNHETAKKKCAFCFSSSLGKYASSPPPIDAFIQPDNGTILEFFLGAAPEKPAPGSFYATGPPVRFLI
ncbi:MAG: hypothetical protein IT559_09485 [Alphaproteobacteria bacterium]|nr:hypothetical protein [Alphaproteobacteria bacterium]